MGSSYFNTSSYLNKEVAKSPLNLGNKTDLFEYKGKKDLFDFEKIIKKTNEKENKGEIEEDKGKGFLDKQLGNYKAYLDATKEDKSDEDKDRDIIRELAGKNNLSTVLGDMGKGFSSEVAQGLTAYNPPSPNQQMFIPGQEATGKSLGQRLAGAAVGLGKGLLTGVPHGGAFGAVSGFFG